MSVILERDRFEKMIDGFVDTVGGMYVRDWLTELAERYKVAEAAEVAPTVECAGCFRTSGLDTEVYCVECYEATREEG